MTKDMQITSVQFSPSGTTKMVADAAAHQIGAKVRALDFLREPPTQTIVMGEQEVLLVAMPVFAGRIPAVCVPLLQKLQGNHTPAILIVAYGNRAYEDALLELSDVLTGQGFCVIGAGTFVAEHSIFHTVAQGRPDAADFAKLTQFMGECIKKLQSFEGTSPVLSVKGNRPYKAASSIPLKPKTNGDCTACGVCARICPTGAIDIMTPKKTDDAKCITCTACIAACPTHARALRGVMFGVASKQFASKNSARCEPEWFV